jgi:hypothetical protein
MRCFGAFKVREIGGASENVGQDFQIMNSCAIFSQERARLEVLVFRSNDWRFSDDEVFCIFFAVREGEGTSDAVSFGRVNCPASEIAQCRPRLAGSHRPKRVDS